MNPHLQDVIVLGVVLGAVAFVTVRWARYWRRSTRGSACGGCGSGAGTGCGVGKDPRRATAPRGDVEAPRARRVMVELEPTRRREGEPRG